MQAIFFSLVTFFGWGVGDIFATISSRKIGGLSFTFWIYVFAFIITSLYLPFQINMLPQFTLPILLLCLLLGLALTVGNIMFAEAVNISSANLVGVISSSAYSGSAVILSAIFFREPLNLFKIFSFVLVASGVIICSINFKELMGGNLKKLIKDRGVLYAILAMIFWSIDAVFLKIAISRVGWFWPMYISLLFFPAIFILMKNRKIKLSSPFKKGAFIPILFAAILLYGGEFTYSLGLLSGSPSLVSSISGAYPALFAAVAFFVFKDKLKKQQVIGIITTLVGVLTLSFFG